MIGNESRRCDQNRYAETCFVNLERAGCHWSCVFLAKHQDFKSLRTLSLISRTLVWKQFYRSNHLNCWFPMQIIIWITKIKQTVEQLKQQPGTGFACKSSAVSATADSLEAFSKWTILIRLGEYPERDQWDRSDLISDIRKVFRSISNPIVIHVWGSPAVRNGMKPLMGLQKYFKKWRNKKSLSIKIIKTTKKFDCYHKKVWRWAVWTRGLERG